MSSEEGPAGEAGKKDDIYESQGSKKLVRLITVMAYMFSVSFVAIVLSAYYIFLWEPPNPRLFRKPVHLSGEPEVQFLKGDPPIITDQSKQHQPDNFLPNGVPVKFAGRIADDTSDMSDLINDPDQVMKDRGRLDESLFLLRNSLMELLRNRGDDSKRDRDSTVKSWAAANFTKYASLEEGGRPKLMGMPGEESAALQDESEMTSGDIISPEVSDNGTFPALVSSSISGDEANKDRFTDAANSAIYKSSPNGYLLNRNLTENSAVTQGRRENRVPASFRAENGTAVIKKDINIAIDGVGNTSAINQNSRSDSPSESFTTTGAFTIINDTDRIMTPRNIENLETQRNRVRVYHINRSVINQSATNSSDNFDFTPASDLSSVKPANAVANFKGKTSFLQFTRCII